MNTLPTAVLAWSLIALLPAGASASLAAYKVTNAIVGEAAASPYPVKLAVAHAIQNRGTLRGVYGLDAAHNRREPARVWAEARRAWAAVPSTPDTTHGATHFGTQSDVATGIYSGMKLTAVIGSGKHATYFFKP